MRNFQDTFETRMRSFISAFSIWLTVPSKTHLRTSLRHSLSSLYYSNKRKTYGRYDLNNKIKISFKNYPWMNSSLQYVSLMIPFIFFELAFSRRRLISYRNQPMDLHDWFLYNIGLCRERVKESFWNILY